jgi:hypothetical protein
MIHEPLSRPITIFIGVANALGNNSIMPEATD